MRNPTSGVVVEGTLRADSSVAMSIDPQGMAHIMGVLTNLYSDAPLAVLREYSTNARDAHQAAGIDRPIEVSLPTALDPTLRVRDFGVGLSEQDILGVYARYGSSTKRGSDEQVGAFGLGSKSAFTLAQQFLVTSVHDGRCTTVLFALGADGIGSVSVLHRGEAQEPSGVQIEIGVPQPHLVRATAARFFGTWPAGSVLVDGATPVSVRDGAVLTCEGLVLADPQSEVTAEGWNLVMGGVGYPLPRALLLRAVRDKDAPEARAALGTHGFRSVYATVPIGAVDITPSREGLRDTARTVRAVRSVLDALPDLLATQVQAELDAAGTATQAAWLLAGYQRALDKHLLPTARLTYRGAPIGAPVTVPLTTMTLTARRGSRGGRELRVDDNLLVSTANMRDVLVVTDTPKGAARNHPARRYLTQNSDGTQWVVFTADSAATFDWFAYGPGSPVKTVPYPMFRHQIDEYSTGTTRRATVYRTLAPQDGEPVERPVPWLREQPPPVVLTPQFFGSQVARQVFHDRPMVLLTDRQSLAGLIRRVPGAKDGERLLCDGARHLLRNLSDYQRETLTASVIVDRFEQTARNIDRVFGRRAQQVPGMRRLLADYQRAQRICLDRARDRTLLISAHHTAGTPLPPLRPEHQRQLDDLLDRAPLLTALLRAGQLTDDELDAALAYLTTALPNAA
jgi:hypothetical protein